MTSWYLPPSKKKTLTAIVRKHFIEKMDEPTKKLLGQATFAIFEGACHEDDFPGYSKAVVTLKEWSDDNITEVWVGEDGSVIDYDPETRHGGSVAVEFVHVGLRQARSEVFHELF